MTGPRRLTMSIEPSPASLPAPSVAFSAKPFDELTLRELYALLWLRDEVFVVGQKITAESEVDGEDPHCTHVIGRSADGKIVATARVFLEVSPVKVGRVAVHPQLQGQGVGTQLMRYVNDLIGDRPATMSAQAHLQRWYTSVGWRGVGAVYTEAEIDHLKMVRP